ncbi:MAG: ATP-binding cassette domain-containing protein [Cryomorphaceae bacterium]|nr:ATP-binding cassette domain-containing protein [Cryomorphaceae bacterium]
MLKLENLQFGHSGALHKPLSIDIESGKLVLLLGTNGSGKSTLLRTLSGIIPPTAGMLKYDQKSVHIMTEKQRAKIIAYVGSKQTSFSGLSVEEVVSLGAWSAGKSTDVAALLASHDLLKLANKRIGEISDGEAQKVMLARAIAQQTSILLMDEPTAFLDHPSRKSWWNNMLQLVTDGKTVVMSTHDIAFIPENHPAIVALCIPATSGEVIVLENVDRAGVERFFGSVEK